MPKNIIQYRDIYVAPGSDLYEAIMSKDVKKAEEIYRHVIAKYNKEFGIDK